jgi:hypothetical protein
LIGQRGHVAAALTANVAGLVRIDDDIEQLGRGTLDVVIARIDERSQLTPAEVHPRVQRLAVDLALRSGAAFGQVDQRHSRKNVRNPGADGAGNRGQDVHQLRRRGDALSGQVSSGKLDDQRNVKDFAIEEHAVLRLPVVAQSFAMIARENDERFVIETTPVEIHEEPPQDCVRGGDLAVVRIGVFRAERFDRLVGRMRLEEMKKKKERPPVHFVEPAESRAYRLAAVPLQGSQGGGLPHFHRVVVKVEE